ncbi:MAG: hypothetical protein ACJ786_17270 [Catenulispora sp.]
MTNLDRIRIERLVWTLDQRLYDLPRRSRIAKRREVRANLLEAAADHGAREALRRIGDSGTLAREYRGAEFGDGPRHSWMAAAWFAALVPLLLNFALSEVANAYGDALNAAHAASGSFTSSGISYLQSPLTYTVDQGSITHSGGAWTPIVYVAWLIGTVACGRLWRLLPTAPSRRQRIPAAEG